MLKRSVVAISMLVLTGAICEKRQEPPLTPTVLFGPDTGQVDLPLTFSTFTGDPEGDSIRYEFYWDDRTRELTEYYSSGTEVQRTHSWSSRGVYRPRVRAQDVHGDSSEWFERPTVSIRGYPKRVIATVRVGAFPYGLAVLPDGKYVYVTDNNMSDTVFVIRTSDNKVATKVVLPRGPDSIVPCDPIGAAALPNGEYVYVTGYTCASVFVIRTSDNAVVARIPVGGYPWGITALPDGSFVYVMCTADDNVWVIRTSDNAVVARIRLGDSQSIDVIALPSGDYVYADGDRISVIRTSINGVVAEVPTDAGFLAPDPGGQYVYATRGSQISVVRVAGNEVVSTFPFDGLAAGVAVLPGGNYLYVPDYYGESVSIIRISDWTVVKKIHVGDTPRPLAISPDGERVYVVNQRDGTVSVIGY